MEDTDSMNFRQQLLSIDENLGKDGVEAFKFLCRDLVSSKKLESVSSAQEIFQHLINNDLLNKEDTFLIAELLYRIKYNSLLKKLGYTKEHVQERLPLQGKVSEYRQMLYEVSEDLTEDDVKSAVFLLRYLLPKKQSTMTALELLTTLEKQDLLAENNLNLLKETFQKISPELLCRVNRYEQNKESGQANKEFEPMITEESLEKSITTIQKPSIKDAPNTKDSYTKAYGSLKEHVAHIHSLPANQDVQAGNTGDHSKMETQLSVGNEKPAQYKMDGQHRGFCIIINNTTFVSHKPRRGSHFDAKELERVFTWLGLEVEMHNDKTTTEVKDILRKWQSCERFRDSDCFVFFILSHGISGQVYGTNGELIPIRTIMSYFTAKRCPLLAQKPKLFFIQACQGEEIHPAFKVEADSDNTIEVQEDAQTSGYISTQQLASSIPDEADFLVGMATVDGYSAFRHVREGAWYIQALCKKLQELVPRGEDILSILTEVNAEVSKRADEKGEKKQMPQPAYTLRKKLIFPIPAVPFHSLQ